MKTVLRRFLRKKLFFIYKTTKLSVLQNFVPPGFTGWLTAIHSLRTGMERFICKIIFVLDIKRPNLLAGKIWFPAKPFLGKSPKMKMVDCQIRP